LGEYLKTPLRVPYWVNWMQTPNQTLSPSPVTGQTQTQKSRKRIYVKVRYYVGANNRLTFYIPMENDVIKEQVIVTDQKWVTEIITYLKTKGKHYKAKHYGYSSLARMHNVYTNDVYVAKVSAKRLLKLIKASKSWIRSEHATRIVQLLTQAGDGNE
jgi:hypothetical protein